MSALAFRTLGGHGPDLVLIHGFGSDRLSWAGNAAALTPVARVHSLDLPGHGESPLDVGDGSLKQLADRVAATLKAQGITKAHLLGHSLGGAIAMELARTAAESVLSLSLITPAGLGAGVDHEFLASYPELSSPEEAAALLSRLVTKPMLINRLTVQRVLTQLDQPGAREALRRIASALQNSGDALVQCVAGIAQTDIPRLVIWGERDVINPLDHSRLSAFGGRSLIVPEAGHLPHIEGARQVNAEIPAFLTVAGHG